MTQGLESLNIKIFADGADLEGMINLYRNPLIKGLTTNPTLMRKVGIQDYESFAKDALAFIKDKPISFEVFSDEFAEMKRQALKIRDWQQNVYVKIPITNSRGESSIPLIRELAAAQVQLNVTAILTLKQVREVAGALRPDIPAVVSVFAGRIADTGKNPDSKTAHLACHVSEHDVIVVELDAEHRVRQRLDHLALEFDLVFLCH